jgi:hypothetical protein
MRKLVFIYLMFVLASCAEKLMEKPENLIPEAKMVEILNDLAIVNAAKVTNIQVLRDNDIEPMQYIFVKHGIDSLQFVESDRYYASIPELHEEIYIEVEEKLEVEKEQLTAEKKIRDSLKVMERQAAKDKTKQVKDSLQESAGKKSQ